MLTSTLPLPTRFLIVLASAAAFACGSSEEDSDPTTTPTAGTGGTQATTGGSGGSSDSGGSGGTTASGGTGGNPAPMGGSGGSGGAASDGGAGGAAAGAGGVPEGEGGAAGAPGEPLPEGVPETYTLQLDIPFDSEESLEMIAAGNPGGWTFTDEDGGALAYQGPGYNPPYESLNAMAIISTMTFSSFVLEVEIMQLSTNAGDPHRDACIVFNAMSPAQFYFSHLSQQRADNRSHELTIINNAGRQLWTDTATNGIAWEVGAWRKFRLVRDATDGATAVYMDDDLENPIQTGSDTTFDSGFIGFGTFNDRGRVRNLKVWAETAEEADGSDFF